MEAHILFQGKNDPPVKTEMKLPIVDLSWVETMTFVLVEGGMKSGEPSVILMSETEGGTVLLQTSLDKFLMAARAFTTGATARWGWQQPEGHVTIMPPDDGTRKAMLESIQKELEEWGDDK